MDRDQWLVRAMFDLNTDIMIIIQCSALWEAALLVGFK